ncbi:MAG: ankyrin repeat domain-containing protein [Acidobacteria bacterium]|nr:ankyrin repeat domain-containing protein [Acidobacteriota bacterium]
MNAQRDSKFNQSIEGRTRLMRAAFEGDLEMAVSLLQQGSYVNARDVDGDTALMFASFNGHFLLVKLLLGHGADVFLRARNGWTARQAALSKSHAEVAALLKRAEEKALTERLPRLDDEFSEEEEV